MLGWLKKLPVPKNGGALLLFWAIVKAFTPISSSSPWDSGGTFSSSMSRRRSATRRTAISIQKGGLVNHCLRGKASAAQSIFPPTQIASELRAIRKVQMQSAQAMNEPISNGLLGVTIE